MPATHGSCLNELTAERTMSKIYSRETAEIERFFSDTLTILHVAEELKRHCRPSLHGKRFLTDAQLSEKLGISRRTLQDLRDRHVIPYYRLDGKVLYEESDIEDFLMSTYRPKF